MTLSESNLRKALHERFRALLGSPSGDEVAYHLADLHGGLIHAARTIQEIGTLDTTDGDAPLRGKLAELGGELFEHIDPHLKGVRVALEELIADLYEQAERRGEL